MNWRDHVTADPEILGGKPVLRGTRIAVDFLLGLFSQGWTTEQVLESYPQLDETSVRAAFACAAETLGDEATYPSARKTGS